jgi:Putative transposase
MRCAGRWLASFVRAVFGSLRRRARQAGVLGGRGGAVAIVQRFGAALSLNVHVHALILDGVYVRDDRARPFHRRAPAQALAELSTGYWLRMRRSIQRGAARSPSRWNSTTVQGR